jgi:MFS family permease
LYAYSFLDDFVLLYPVYGLLFARNGLSVAQISSLFAIWSVTGFVLEIPTGVLADAVSRRLLLCLGPLLSAVGFGLWVAAPSYWAFATGFVLWGIDGALRSGALEALVYEELEARGRADRYARVMGRARAAGVAATMVAGAVAGPVLAVGGYLALGAASVAVRLAAAGIGTALPEHRRRGEPDREAEAETGLSYLGTLRSALREARTDQTVRRALLLVPVVASVWGALEEYVPLLAADVGVPARTVPLLVLLVSLGMTAGGLLAARWPMLGGRSLGYLLGGGALLLAAGAGSGHPAGFVALAASFGAFQLATVAADTRLQEAIGGSARATVTSLAGLGTEVCTVLVFGGYALASGHTGHPTIFALFATVYLAVAAFTLRRPSG